MKENISGIWSKYINVNQDFSYGVNVNIVFYITLQFDPKDDTHIPFQPIWPEKYETQTPFVCIFI